MYGLLANMKGEKWLHEQGEMVWQFCFAPMEHLGMKLCNMLAAENKNRVVTPLLLRTGQDQKEYQP